MKLPTKTLSQMILGFFVLLVQGSCILPKTDESTIQLTPGEGGAGAECSTVPQCQLRCSTVFETSKDLYDKCLQETADDVIELDKAISAMEKGSWKSIKAESLKVLVGFDEDIWPKYAGVRNKTTVQEMLLWVTENEDIANHLDEEHEVLKNAFSVLGAPASQSEVVREGMKKDVDIKEKRTFFEVSVFKKNKPAFEKAHQLLVKECDKDRFCIKNFYCALNKTLVFGKLNEYDLAKDTQKGGSLNQADCDD